jgi:hypothetical protein
MIQQTKAQRNQKQEKGSNRKKLWVDVSNSKSAFSLGWNFGESSVQQIGSGVRARCPVTDAEECLLIDSIFIYEALVTQNTNVLRNHVIICSWFLA